MRVLLDVPGMSQYSDEVKNNFQTSACGPVTTHVILNYLCQKTDLPLPKKNINELYKFLGGTKIGLFKWRLIRNLKKLLGPDWKIASCDIDEAIMQLRLGVPVAMRFDVYFSGQYFKVKNPTFKYHWVPLIGYEVKNDGLYCIIHDNGGRNRESRIRWIKYTPQRAIISFVKIEPPNLLLHLKH